MRYVSKNLPAWLALYFKCVAQVQRFFYPSFLPIVCLFYNKIVKCNEQKTEM